MDWESFCLACYKGTRNFAPENQILNIKKMKTTQILLMVLAIASFMNKSVACPMNGKFSLKSLSTTVSDATIESSDSLFGGGKISFIGGGHGGGGGNHTPIGPGYVSPVDAYFIVYASNEQLLFVNSLDVVQIVPFTIEDESGETVEETSVYIPAAGSGTFNISSLEGDQQYRIVVSINGTYYYGYFYKEE